MLGCELRREYVSKRKKEITRRQNVFTKKCYESLAMTEASNEVALALAISGTLFLTEKTLLSLVS